jgi:hypothetical protein
MDEELKQNENLERIFEEIGYYWYQ